MKFRKCLHIFLAAAALLALAGCTSASDEPEVSDGDVTLNLRIMVGETLGLTDTRALPTRFDKEKEDNTTEEPSSNYEKVRSLRVIIVRGSRVRPGDENIGSGVDFAKNGVIEHNRLVIIDPESPSSSLNVLNDNLEFLVKSGEYKSIYLFANEDAIAEDFKKSVGTSLRELVPGQTFPTEAVLNATFSREPDHAWIDNTQLHQDVEQNPKSTIPMCERFTNVAIPVPVSVATLRLTKSFFVVRTAVKFSFCFKTAADFVAPIDPVTKKHLRIDEVQINGLANKAYILPHDVTYSPPKDEVLEGPNVDRFIVDFSVPEDAGSSSLTVHFTSISEEDENQLPYVPFLTSGMELPLSAYLYVPETIASTTDPITVAVKLSHGELYHAAVPLEMDKIPRNTHVKINIIFSNEKIQATVDLVPYKEVILKPGFGF